MLFDSSLRTELRRGVLGTLLILVTVVLTMILIRMLGLAAKGNVAATDVSLLMGYSLIAQLPTLTSLSLFVAVVMLLNRLHRDHEMLVWQASGVRLMRILQPIVQMSLPILLGLAVLVFFARPWSQQQTDLMRQRFEQRTDMARVSPGQFQVSADGKRIFFIDSHSASQEAGRNVFIFIRGDNKEAVIHAKEGTIELENGWRYLSLLHGERVETNTETGQTQRAAFEDANILLGAAPQLVTQVQSPRSKSMQQLLNSSQRADQAEWVWRIGSIWSCLNLVLIALGSSTSQVRQTNAWRLLWALLAFIAYFNVLSLSQSWVATGRLSPAAALFGIHGLVTAASLAWLYWRDGSWRHGRMPVEARA